jgi:hypothetical protein
LNYTWSHAIDEVSNDTGSQFLSRGNADFDVRHNFSGAIHYDLPNLKSGTIADAIFRGWSIDSIVHVQSGLPIYLRLSSNTIIDGIVVFVRPDYIQGQPLYIDDPRVPGGRRFNTAAFKNPPVNPAFPSIRQMGSFGRNVLRGLPLSQIDFALGRAFSFGEKLKLQFKGELFNLLNHPNFGVYGTTFTNSNTFGVPTRTFGNSLGTGIGGLNSLYQIGGPRRVQLSVRLTF